MKDIYPTWYKAAESIKKSQQSIKVITGARRPNLHIYPLAPNAFQVTSQKAKRREAKPYKRKGRKKGFYNGL